MIGCRAGSARIGYELLCGIHAGSVRGLEGFGYLVISRVELQGSVCADMEEPWAIEGSIIRFRVSRSTRNRNPGR